MNRTAPIVAAFLMAGCAGSDAELSRSEAQARINEALLDQRFAYLFIADAKGCVLMPPSSEVTLSVSGYGRGAVAPGVIVGNAESATLEILAVKDGYSKITTTSYATPESSPDICKKEWDRRPPSPLPVKAIEWTITPTAKARSVGVKTKYGLLQVAFRPEVSAITGLVASSEVTRTAEFLWVWTPKKVDAIDPEIESPPPDRGALKVTGSPNFPNGHGQAEFRKYDDGWRLSLDSLQF